MAGPAQLSEAARAALRCPVCLAGFGCFEDRLQCNRCKRNFPIASGGVPVLIDESRSIFRTASYVEGRPTFFEPHGRLFRRIERLVPSPSLKPRTRRNYRLLRDMLTAGDRRARVLVVGAGFGGFGIDELDCAAIDLVVTDVAATPGTALICDAHCLPFKDGSFDAVVAQDVLQHVVDPFRCAAEIHRVLVPTGLLYAEIAFVQQISGGSRDYLRFTQLGARRLFRDFEEIASGAAMGPGTAMLWSYEHLLQALVTSSRLRYVVKVFARITGVFFKYLDYLVIDRPEAMDGACAVYFLGRKSAERVPDEELAGLYRGAWAAPESTAGPRLDREHGA